MKITTKKGKDPTPLYIAEIRKDVAKMYTNGAIQKSEELFESRLP